MPNKASIRQRKYDFTHCKTYSLKFNLETDSDVIEQLEKQESKQGYIKTLVREDMKKMKYAHQITRYYGNNDTRLLLPEKADYIYSTTDPLQIAEVYHGTDENGNSIYLYDMTGAYTGSGLTAQELSRELEEIFDGMQYTIKEEYLPLWGSWANEGTIVTGKDIGQLASEWNKPIRELIKQVEPV